LKVFKAAADRAGVVEAFVPSISPANVERWQRNEYYKSHDEYLEAIGEAMGSCCRSTIPPWRRATP
jgi:hypothetical protein